MVRRCGGSDAGGHAQRSGGCPPSVRAAAAPRPRGSTRARGRAEALPPPAQLLDARTRIPTSITLDTASAVAGPPPSQGQTSRSAGLGQPAPAETAQPRQQTGASRAPYRRNDGRVAAQRLPGLGRGRSGAAGRVPATGGPPAWGGALALGVVLRSSAPPGMGGPNGLKPSAPYRQPVMEIVPCVLSRTAVCPWNETLEM